MAKEPGKTKEAAPAPAPAADLRSTLIKRLAVAGVLVAVLLGVLAFFDYLATQEEPEPTVYTKPVPVAPKKEVTQPVKPAETLPEPPPAEKEAEKGAEKGVEKGAEKPAAPPPPPTVEAQPKPAVPAKPALPAAPAPEPRPAVKAPVHPLTPPASPVPPSRPTPPKPATAPESTAAPAGRAPVEPPAPPRPVEPPLARPQAPVMPRPQLQPPAPPRLFSGYVVQAGVFSNVRQAEELHAKLTLNGIPSTLEARVQVGPFRNRAEADAAREKLKTLGVEAIVIPPNAGH